MSFVTQEDVFAAIEPVLHGVFEEFSKGKNGYSSAISSNHVQESMLKYGSDKPDLRNPIEIVDVTHIFRGGGFGVFAAAIEEGAVVRAIPAPGAGVRARSFFDQTNAWAKAEGFAGLGYINFKGGEGGGGVAKNLGPETSRSIGQRNGARSDDGVFFACAKESIAAKLAGMARTRVGQD